MIRRVTRPGITIWEKRLFAVRTLLSEANQIGVAGPRKAAFPSLISLANGDGTRRLHGNVLSAAKRFLLSESGWSFDDYHFMKRFEDLDTAIRSFMFGMQRSECGTYSIAIDCGSARVISTFLALHGGPGTTLMVPRPFYHGIIDWCCATRTNLSVIETKANNDYKVCPRELDTVFNSARRNGQRACALLLANPGFTGNTYARKELLDVLKWCRRHEVVFVLDIAFRGTEFSHVSCPLTFARQWKHLLVTGSVSKAFNLPNIRVGWACGDTDIVKELEDYRERTMGSVPFLCQAMAAAALNAPKKYLRVNARECAFRVEMVKDFVEKTNRREVTGRRGRRIVEILHLPRAGHGILLSAPGTKGRSCSDGSVINNSLDLASILLRDFGVIVSPAFSQGFQGMEFRIGVASVGLLEARMMTQFEERERLDSVGETSKKQPSMVDTRESAIFAQGRRMLKEGLDRIMRCLWSLS